MVNDTRFGDAANDWELDLVDVYLADVRRRPRLSIPETLKLFEQLHNTTDPTSRLDIRNQIVEGHLRLAVHVAFDFRRTGLNLGDLFQAASIGLMKAVENFDPNRGSWAKYAPTIIRRAVLTEVERAGRTVRLPERVHRRLRKLLKVEGRLIQKVQGEPTAADYAAELGWGEPFVEQLLRDTALIGEIDAPVYRTSTDGSAKEVGTFGSLLPTTEPSPEDRQIDASEKARGAKAVEAMFDRAGLTDLERRAIWLRHLDDEPLSNREVAAALGISIRRAKGLADRGTKKLHRLTPRTAPAPSQGEGR